MTGETSKRSIIMVDKLNDLRDPSPIPSIVEEKKKPAKITLKKEMSRDNHQREETPSIIQVDESIQVISTKKPLLIPPIVGGHNGAVDGVMGSIIGRHNSNDAIEEEKSRKPKTLQKRRKVRGGKVDNSLSRLEEMEMVTPERRKLPVQEEMDQMNAGDDGGDKMPLPRINVNLHRNDRSKEDSLKLPAISKRAQDIIEKNNQRLGKIREMSRAYKAEAHRLEQIIGNPLKIHRKYEL